MVTRAAVALALLTGCSLLGLDTFMVPTCTTDDDCAALNASEGIDPASACELYQCIEATGECDRRRFDGDDDGIALARCAVLERDCDDGDPLTSAITALTISPLIEPVAAPQWVHYALGPNELAVSYPADDRRAAFDVLTPSLDVSPPTLIGFMADRFDAAATAPIDESSAAIVSGAPETLSTAAPEPATPVVNNDPPLPMECTEHAQCYDDDFCNGYETCEPTSGMPDDRGCRARLPSDALCPGSCDGTLERCVEPSAPVSTVPAELAAAYARDDEWFAVAIDERGCASGRVRLGYLTTGELDEVNGVPGPNVLSRGTDRRAPGYTGIDPDGEARGCTGGRRAEGEPRGASSPAIASLPPDPANDRFRPQALAAWIADVHCRGTGGSGCTPSPDAAIEVIGMWLEEAPPRAGSPRITWTTATGEGLPQTLEARTDDDVPPAIAPVARRGFVLAYAAAGGGIAMRFIPAWSDPAGVSGVAPHGTSLPSSPDTLRRPTAAIALGAEQIIGAAATSSVTIAVGRVTETTAELRVAWIEGGALELAAGTLTLSSGAFSIDEPTRISAAATAPALVYGADGVCGFGCGGYALAYRQGSSVMLQRFDDEGASVGAASSIGAGSHPQPFIRGSSVHVAFYDTQGAIVISSGVCPGP
jgi:hypothetical protein